MSFDRTTCVCQTGPALRQQLMRFLKYAKAQDQTRKHIKELSFVISSLLIFNFGSLVLFCFRTLERKRRNLNTSMFPRSVIYFFNARRLDCLDLCLVYSSVSYSPYFPCSRASSFDMLVLSSRLSRFGSAFCSSVFVKIKEHYYLDFSCLLHLTIFCIWVLNS